MAKISNTLAYPNQNPINPEDYLIGTDGLSSPIELQTKTFTIAGLADYILNTVTPPASSETFIVNGMFKAIGSNTGGGVGPEFSKDFLEWTSAVTPITQVPLWRVPVTLQLKLVTWAWVSDTVMNIPAGDTMTVSIGTVANNAISNFANYSKKEDLFVISDLYDKSYPRGEVDVSDLGIVLNAFQNVGVVCEGSQNSGITPTNGDMELSFYFEKTNAIEPEAPVTVTLNPFNNNIIDNTAGAPNYTLSGNELNDTKQGQPGVSYQFITNGLANTGYQFKASAPFTATNPGGIFTVDGTETQTLTGEIEVIPIIPVGPEWTSTDPVNAEKYPNLQPNDTWTYNWTTSDDNTPCADLDYVITVDGVEIFPAAGASWLTFTDNGDCTGTLTGTYPGGNIDVVMTVTDNDGLSATQDFTISGLTVTGNTFFQFWNDTSGSMNSTIEVTSQIASMTGIKIASSFTASGSTVIKTRSTFNVGLATNFDASVGSGVFGAFLLVRDGMEITGTGIPAGTFVVTGQNNPEHFGLVNANGSPVALPAQIGTGFELTFNLTDALKSADYADTSNLRNLLQDFYATGGTEASGNTDRATNGSDDFESRVYWGMSAEERQIGMLANKGFGDTIGPGGYYPDADNVVILAFGDESGGGGDNYYMDCGGSICWENRENATNANIVDDIGAVRSFISTLETAAGTTNIYRSKFFHTLSGIGTIAPLVSPNGMLAAANFTNPPVSDSYPAGDPGEPLSIPATAYTNVTMLNDYTTSTPPRMYWSVDLDNFPANPEQYWYDQIRDTLVTMGFNV
ncbi:MAG: hypothetical protein GOVbin225_13 [Prokaryotic dsDNA virus sp.]|nr:MAG: hypothetical protein GOVbin225_13 [Prokaryotic dsDNA virus sp.]|tara:strand:+ start:1048 stop:3435 length:2388 start_codon:yes stop_codon:yes gene_type:complete